jgi:hypothetical protein
MTLRHAVVISVAILLLLFILQALAPHDGGLWPDAALPVPPDDLWRLNQ